MKVIKYEHHGEEVSVMDTLKGSHRTHCLCHAKCVFFHPEGPRHLNCNVAEEVFALCKREHLVLPVWECPDYSTGEEWKENG